MRQELGWNVVAESLIHLVEDAGHALAIDHHDPVLATTRASDPDKRFKIDFRRHGLVERNHLSRFGIPGSRHETQEGRCQSG